MIYIYLYLAIGIIISAISYVSHARKEKDLDEVVQEKLHELRDDGSFCFQSANIVGHLLAFAISILFWPLLAIRKVLGS